MEGRRVLHGKQLQEILSRSRTSLLLSSGEWVKIVVRGLNGSLSSGEWVKKVS